MTTNHVNIGGNDFQLLSTLGKGTYGSVFLINYKGDKKALKIITNELEEGIKSLREVDIMGKLRHPNLVFSEAIFTSVNSNITLGLIMPLATTDLYKIMPSLTVQQKLGFLYDIMKGLKFLHENGYAHLDLKPMNVLIYDSGYSTEAKLTDFGLSLLVYPNKSKHYPLNLVTITYRPPEILNGSWEYGTFTDIWSLGIIFIEVLSGGKGLYTKYDMETIKNTINNKLSPEVISNTLYPYLYMLDITNKSHAINIISQMLSFDINKRPTVEQIMNSPLFSSYNNKSIGEVVYETPKPPRLCNVIHYYGFDYLLRTSLKIPNLRLETLFLAGDIYQRSLAYGHSLTGDFNKDWANTILISSTSLYMAVKMIESIYVRPEQLVDIGKKIFTKLDVLNVEAVLTQIFNGIIYPKNLFTETNTYQGLIKGFKMLNNCHLYHRVDLNKWKNLQPPTTDFDRNILLSDFIKTTDYYQLLNQDKDKYIPNLYNENL